MFSNLALITTLLLATLAVLHSADSSAPELALQPAHIVGAPSKQHIPPTVRPELALQHPKDGAHPGDAGHFLNLACFYDALTGESPVGKLTRAYPVWPHGLPKAETEEAKAAEAAKIAAFQPDAYQAKMPKWMHRNMAEKLTATLDDATARYLETVAWENWKEADEKLRAAISTK